MTQTSLDIAAISELVKLFDEDRKEEVLLKLCKDKKVIMPFRKILEISTNEQNKRYVLNLEAALRGSKEYFSKKDAALEGIIAFLRSKI